MFGFASQKKHSSAISNHSVASIRPSYLQLPLASDRGIPVFEIEVVESSSSSAPRRHQDIHPHHGYRPPQNFVHHHLYHLLFLHAIKHGMFERSRCLEACSKVSLSSCVRSPFSIPFHSRPNHRLGHLSHSIRSASGCIRSYASYSHSGMLPKLPSY